MGAQLPGGTPQQAAPGKPEPLHHGLVGRIRNYFLTGLILVGPLYITVNLTWWFINWVDDLVRPLIPVACRPETYLPIKVPGSGLIIAFAAMTLLGFLTANFVGRKLVEFGENILNRMPVVRPIYKSLKQIFETFFSKTGSSFRRVGLVEFPAPGCGRWCSFQIRRAPTSPRGFPTPTISRHSCRARRTRRQGSSSTCRAAISSISTLRSRPQ